MTEVYSRYVSLDGTRHKDRDVRWKGGHGFLRTDFASTLGRSEARVVRCLSMANVVSSVVAAECPRGWPSGPLRVEVDTIFF